MNLEVESLKQLVNSLKDGVSIVNYKKTIEPKKREIKKHGEIGTIEKRSVMEIRVGIDYADIEKPETESDGEPKEKRQVNSNMEKIDVSIYYHTVKDCYYIGCQPISHIKTEYLLNGEVVELDDEVVDGVQLKDFLYSKDLNSNSDLIWFQLSVDNIENIEKKC